MLPTQFIPWLQPLQDIALGVITPYLSRIVTTPSTPKIVKYLVLMVFCILVGLLDAIASGASLSPDIVSKRILPILATAFTMIHKLEEAGGLDAWDVKTTNGFRHLRDSFLTLLKTGESKEGDVKLSPLSALAAKEMRLRTLFEQKRITKDEYDSQLSKLISERQAALDAELGEIQ